ncbi:MAG: indolepyruvate ferredoxin oxidoreductase subunit alpha [Firmicutes bacterium]|nr:indolepyruvate ferredoxin oxidoreductase subunit alpha [Bacillota bacterium]
MKTLMLGNEAVARGAWEAGARVASAYPGTPSTEITEFIAKYDEIFSEWAPNEKVAVEVALGASVIGGRAVAAMKHVGLNVASDPLFTASYTGVNGGLVICVADDQGMHSSQNEQDSRHYAKSSKTLMLEPADSAECRDFVMRAFGLSEEFDTPVLIRLSTRVSHSRGLVEPGGRTEVPLKKYVKDVSKYVMAPASAKGRHVFVEERALREREWAETSDLNRIEMHDAKIGVIAAGIAYQYAREALGARASYLKLGAVYPLPDKLLRDFRASVDVCYVMEELDPIIEEHCKQLGLEVIGKAVFPMTFEYSAPMIKKAVLGEDTETPDVSPLGEIPARPPVMCSGCPHRGVFYVLKQMKLTVSGDIGCYTLGANPPLGAMDTTVCMGASVGMAHGMEKAAGRARAEKTVAVIGDSTFVHSGITGLIDIVYNKGTSTVIILDNSITGMTGHQQNPATGITIKGEKTRAVDLKKLCEAVGVERVVVADPFDVDTFRKILEAELKAEEPSVIIARRPCKLLKGVEYEERYVVNKELCKECGFCMNIGCPSLVRKNGKVTINETQCVGCGYCYRVCKFKAIEPKPKAKEGEVLS